MILSCLAFATRAYLNTYQDTLSTTDAVVPDAPCDALSLGISFTAQQATATTSDIVHVRQPVDCPEPKNPAAPRQGCTCPDGGTTLVCPDAGASGGTDGGT